MVYFDNTTETQRVHIPRTDIEASAYHPSTGGTERYYAGTNIEITPTNVINVTGLTEAIQETVTAMTLDYATTGDVETMISEATSDFVTSGDVQSQITSQTQNFVTSGDVETMVSGFTTTGDVETMISSATSGMATTQDVENAVSGKADTTAVTQSISDALTAYTPTTDFATINGSAITEGGDIVIEGGGDASSVEMITELPIDPVDGAVYNYNGTLVKYVDAAGKWGVWYGINATKSYSYKDNNNVGNTAILTYAVIPDEMDGKLLCVCHYFTSNYLYPYFDLENDCLNVYTNSADTTTTAYIVRHNGGPVTMNLTQYQTVICEWSENRIRITQNGGLTYNIIDTPCSVETNTAHYELTSIPGAYVKGNLYPECGVIPYVAENGIVDGFSYAVDSGYVKINGTYRYFIKGRSYASWGDIYVPTTSGVTGSLCVSQGNVAPVWKTIAQALGIDFWTGTQAEYDAMASHNATTLYIIVEDNS